MVRRDMCTKYDGLALKQIQRNERVGRFIGVVEEVMMLKRKQEALEKQYRFVVLPDGKFRKHWDAIMLLGLMYVSLFTPFQLSYLSDHT